MSEWRDIESAPKDGTVILAKNDCMEQPVEARWGDYYPSYGGPPQVTWTVWRDLDEYPCIPRGALLVPTHWMPLPAPPEAA